MLREKSALNIAAVSSQNIKERDYWMQKLFEPPTPVGFPYDHQTDSIERNPNHPPGHLTLEIEKIKFSRDLSAKLIEMSNGSDARLFMILVAGLTALINKYTGKSDIIVGTSIIKQEEGIRLINEVLALRNRVESHMTFKELILQVKETFLRAVEHQDYPYETLLYKLGIASPGIEPSLFEVVILLEPLHEKRYILYTHPNILLSFRSVSGYIEGEMEYNPDLYCGTTARRMVSHLENLLQKVLFDIEITLPRLDILSEQERKRLVVEFNDTAAPYSADKTIPELFEAQVEKTPDTTAFVETDEDCFMTYGALNRQANHLATELRARSAAPDNIVGIMVDQPIHMVIGLMAILKAGAAYLPLDPTYPVEREKYLVQDSGIRLLIMDSPLFEPKKEVYQGISPANIISLEKEKNQSYDPGDAVNPPNINRPGDLAYILYTSGTTGKPKGVMIRHTSVVNLLTWYGKTYNIKEGDRILQLSHYTFDPSVEDIFGTFLYGATLYIGSRELPADRQQFTRFVEKHQINLVDFVPTVLNELLGSRERLSSLKVVIVGGEVLTEKVKNKIIENGYRLYNHYGPTEITVDALAEECSRANVTIGRPISNITCYILDNFYNPVPFGVGGELFVSGAGVGRGYLNNPDLTGQMFIKNPFNPGERMYRTGDLARWQPDGKIQFLGRLDQQVKIRGHRVELKEIENCLLKHRDIKEAVVIAHQDDKEEARLYAYIVSIKEFSQGEIAEYLSNYLPSCMIPRYSMQIQKLPLTSNGKIDRKMLPVPNTKTREMVVPPSDEVEEKLVEIWSEVLGIEKHTISINAGFFELGGYSLNAAIVISRIRKDFNVNVPLVELFKTDTVKFLAEYIRNGHPESRTADKDLILLSPGTDSTSNLFLIYDGSGGVEGYMELCHHLHIEFNCWGICAAPPGTLAPLNLTIRDIAATYVEKIKTVQPSGPYFLSGYSIGGTIAFEIALQMEEIQEDVSFLGLIDAPGPGENRTEGMGPFNMESELAWLRELLPDEKIKEKLNQVINIDELWATLVNHLEENYPGVETVKQFIPERLAWEIPYYDQQGTRDLIYYLNFNRSLGNALAFYTPAKKINTSIHYIKASQTPGISKKYWKDYCLKPISFHEITGNHFALLTKPNVVRIARLFDRIMLEAMKSSNKISKSHKIGEKQ